jgi:signal transduction histidine kinase
MKAPLRVLVVEDNAGDARLLREMFSKEKAGSFEVTHLLRISEALVHLAKTKVDIVLLDMGLPDGHGLETVRRTRAVVPNIPVIVLTGLDDEVLAAEAMKEGAQDYLIKGQIENRALPRALRHAIERHRMQAETDLIRTHQLQFKDEFLSHVSHELRSPLNAIYQFVTILQDNLAGELSADQHQYLEIVLRNVKQLQAMIDDLLQVTRVQAGKLAIEPQCTSVAEAIGDAVNTLQETAAAKGIVLSVDIEEQLPLACADPTRIRQILIILLDNAIKFTPANGAVRVQAGMLEDNSKLLVFSVSDTGCGIAAGMTERIFERLFQASDPASAGRQGLGLGLYICKELVTLQGGQIWAESIPGSGAVLSVTLPVFSLPNLIAPAFVSARRTQSPLTVVVSQIGSQTGWLSDEERAQHTQGVRDLLQRCLLSDLDVLLPKMGSAGSAELFFIVAMTDSIGAESLTKRIKQQFDASDPIQRAGLTLSTSYKSLATTERDAADSMAVSLERVATNIQKLVDEELSSRMVMNG